MSPKDINVGQLYQHTQHAQTVYLGCGERYKSKFLVIVEEEAKGGFSRLGAKVLSPKKCKNDFWEHFFKI